MTPPRSAAFQLTPGIDRLERPLERSVVAIGNFDGVHLGHREIIRTAVDQARNLSAESVVYTFKPHPQIALRPERGLRLLTSYGERAALLEELGIDRVLEEPFNRDFSSMRAEVFFEGIIVKRLRAKAIVVGYDFAFGKDRGGSLEALRDFCARAQVALTVIPPFTLEGETASSSRIREHLLAGRMVEAAKLMGSHFSYSGRVLRGDGRGRKLGFPTANLSLADPGPATLGEKIALPYGVYATLTRVPGGKTELSVTNLGVRPTFSAASGSREMPLIETHLLNFSEDLYDRDIRVEFVERLREEKKFAGIEALKAQISADIGQAKLILQALKKPGRTEP